MRRAIWMLSAMTSMLVIVLPTAARGTVAGHSMTAGTTADWYQQFLYAGGNRVNPKETILTPQNVGGLTQYWVQSATLSPYAAPVVDNGMVFEGGYGCCPGPSQIRALSATTGAVIWTYDTPTSIVATAAVSHGIVFDGDYNGVLYALNEKTGKLIWSGQAGNQFFEPDHITVAGSVVYATTMSPGGTTPAALTAWNSSGCGSATCKPLWTAPLPAAPAGPATDGKTVFITAGNNQVYAFAAGGCGHPSCTPLWRAITSTGTFGDPYHSLVVANGTVYVYGNGPLVDAFRASGCGASQCVPQWAYSAPGGALGALAVAQNTLYVAAAKGLEAFPASCPTGTVCSTPTWTDPAAPSASLLVANGVAYATSGSTVLADNATTGARLWDTSIPGSNPPRNGPTVANGTVYVADTTGAEILAYHL